MEKKIPFTVIVGAPATGKTLNQASLAAHFGCSAVVDADALFPTGIFCLSKRVLILANRTPVRDPRDRRRFLPQSVIVGIEAAKAALGSNWIEPKR